MDIASQMLLRWERFGPDNEILCSDEFTRYPNPNCCVAVYISYANTEIS